MGDKMWYEMSDEEINELPEMTLEEFDTENARLDAENGWKLVNGQYINVEPRPQGPSGKISIVEQANVVVEKMASDKLANRYHATADSRLGEARNLISGLMNRGWTKAEAQYFVLIMLGQINYRLMNRQFMSDFTEAMREKLSASIGSFGKNAYALTDNQFEAAVKASW